MLIDEDKWRLMEMDCYYTSNGVNLYILICFFLVVIVPTGLKKCKNLSRFWYYG